MAFMHFDKSIEIIENLNIDSYKTKKLYIVEALGYILAEDIIADHNSPEYPTSAMDGYAIIHEDMALVNLNIASINPAGSVTLDEMIGGTCIKTFTGSLMPKGADTLIPIENVSLDGEGIVIKEEVAQGFAIRDIGENYKKGQLLIGKGTQIDFAQIGVLASLNIVSISVYDKPSVAILSTGSELLELGETQTNNSQIRSSNNYILEAMVKKYDGLPIQLGCIKDDKESITKELSRALEMSDIVVTTGGVSVGDFDFVKDVIHEIGCEVLFQGVKVKPGQHIMVARKDDKFIIALPGFAYSSTVTALLYLVPLIAKFQNGKCNLTRIKAKLSENIYKQSDKTEFRACNINLVHGEYYIDFKDKKVGSSAILTNMLGDTALLILDEEDGAKSIGDDVMVVLFD
ncbi:MAG: molybdopterin molybdotransferase MoeA [Sulfurovum sp.]